jgi:hypothetical protein
MRRLRGTCESGNGFAVECETRTRAVPPQEWDDTEVIPPLVRWALPGRLRGGRLLLIKILRGMLPDLPASQENLARWRVPL